MAESLLPLVDVSKSRAINQPDKSYQIIMIAQKGTTQALFHFLLSELIVECSQNIKNHQQQSTDNRLKQIGALIGFKIYNQICLKRGITQRPYNLAQILKSLKTKVFKHLFNYELSPDTNTYRIEQKKAVVYGIVDEVSTYLGWMPENCQVTASMLVAGILQGILTSSDVKCSVSCRKLDSDKGDKNIVEYLIELDQDQNQKWDKK